MLVNGKELLTKAQLGNYAIPAVNFIDLDSARVIVETAERQKKPVILAVAEAHLPIISLEEASLIGKHLAEKSSMPVILHLDHGETESVIKQAIDLGFTSVMIDASKDDLQTNIKKTRNIVEYAKQFDVTVEAEIGHVGSGVNFESHEVNDSVYTEVSDAVTFFEATAIDTLAISIGTSHGFYQGKPEINFKRLTEITEAVPCPLVLHGGSSSGDDNIEQCAISGICKINIFTDFITAAMTRISDNKPHDYLALKNEVNQGMSAELIRYFYLCHTAEVS